MKGQVRVDGQAPLYFDDVDDINAAALRFRQLRPESNRILVSRVAGHGDQHRLDRYVARLFQS
jgi:hypothetical protein